jgi:hypothetical protein
MGGPAIAGLAELDALVAVSCCTELAVGTEDEMAREVEDEPGSVGAGEAGVQLEFVTEVHVVLSGPT